MCQLDEVTNESEFQREVSVSIVDDGVSQIIECVFSNADTSLDDINAISALLGLGALPKVVVTKTDDLPTIVSILPRHNWDIREFGMVICSFLEDESLVLNKFYKTKLAGEVVVTPVNYF